MILRDVKKIKDKSLDELAIGDILKRKSDRMYYDLKSITSPGGFEEMIFSFFGFTVRGARNLKEHFETNDSRKFTIYG